MKSTKYLIIGNSTAAAGCVEGIRSTDKDGGIIIVTDESHHVYSRPLISYLLQGKTDRQRMKYRPDNFYEKNNVELLCSCRAEKINAKENTVLLDNGEKLSYDKLLIATGSRPFVPPFKGLETVTEKHTFMSLDDAEALEKALKKDSRVLIVGGGLIGLKCAEGIYEKCGKITVVDMADRVLSSILDADGAGRISSLLEEKGIDILTSTGVESFEGNSAVFADGNRLEFDVLVVAVGVRANTELVKDAGGEVVRGITADDTQRTSLENIYAAGDCCESYDITFGKSRVLAILPNAYAQGYTAGVNMAGGEARFDKAMPMNAIGFFGLHIITAGTYAGNVYEDITSDSYKKLFYEDNRLKGFILIGNVAKAGIYTSLIREQTPLDSIDFELVCSQPTLIAFSRKYRDEKLGGRK